MHGVKYIHQVWSMDSQGAGLAMLSGTAMLTGGGSLAVEDKLLNGKIAIDVLILTMVYHWRHWHYYV